MLMITLAFVINLLSLLCNFAAYVTPWMYTKPRFLLSGTDNVGMWAACVDGKNCEWFYHNDFSVIQGKEAWEKAAIALFGIAIIFHVVAFLLAFCHVLCCRHRISYTSTVAGFLLLVFILIAISIIVYGVFKHREGVRFKTSGAHFHAAFYLSIVSAAFTLLASLLYACWSGRRD